MNCWPNITDPRAWIWSPIICLQSSVFNRSACYCLISGLRDKGENERGQGTIMHLVLGCTPQACKPCHCPALRPKKEPRDSDRDISGLLDRTSWAKGPRATPYH